MAIKAKTHQVHIFGHLFLVEAQTKAGAIRDLAEHLKRLMAADLATGEQIYQAGLDGNDIIGSDRYKRSVDPAQMTLTGIPETEV